MDFVLGDICLAMTVETEFLRLCYKERGIARGMRTMTDPASTGCNRPMYPFLAQIEVVASETELLNGRNKSVRVHLMAQAALFCGIGGMLLVVDFLLCGFPGFRLCCNLFTRIRDPVKEKTEHLVLRRRLTAPKQRHQDQKQGNEQHLSCCHGPKIRSVSLLDLQRFICPSHLQRASPPVSQRSHLPDSVAAHLS